MIIIRNNYTEKSDSHKWKRTQLTLLNRGIIKYKLTI